ncbi:MAG: bifunctional 5,10-methylenetetrahydrofolate dehydrogenase/5,10-methenyltetrahydrofolate cyclohydrolase [bacterium]
MKIIDGKKIADEILLGVKEKTKEKNLKLGLATILIGDDSASHLYVSLKEKAAKEIGVGFKKYIFSNNVEEKRIIDLIIELNIDKSVNGILIQMPLPNNLDADKLISAIDFKKDIDGLSSNSDFDSPFILAIWEALKNTKEDLKNKKIFALVNSGIFGEKLKDFFKTKKLSLRYSVIPAIHQSTGQAFARICSLDSRFSARGRTRLENDITREDVLITALGCKNCIKSDMIKKGVILIDGGISKFDEKVVGDVDANSVTQKAGWLTPVPGGVGPITIAMLLKNITKDL